MTRKPRKRVIGQRELQEALDVISHKGDDEVEYKDEEPEEASSEPFLQYKSLPCPMPNT